MAGANDRAPDRPERIAGGIDRAARIRAAEQFVRATQRKGMPLTWGTGKLRDDPAWNRDAKRRAARQ